MLGAIAGRIPGVEKLNYVSQFFGNPSDIAFELTHQDDMALGQAVEELEMRYEEFPRCLRFRIPIRQGRDSMTLN